MLQPGVVLLCHGGRPSSSSLSENYHPNIFLSFAFILLTYIRWPAVNPFLYLTLFGARPKPYMSHRGYESPNEGLSGYASGDSTPILRCSSFGILRRDSWVRKLVLIIKQNKLNFLCPRVTANPSWFSIRLGIPTLSIIWEGENVVILFKFEFCNIHVCSILCLPILEIGVQTWRGTALSLTMNFTILRWIQKGVEETYCFQDGVFWISDVLSLYARHLWHYCKSIMTPIFNSVMFYFCLQYCLSDRHLQQNLVDITWQPGWHECFGAGECQS